MFRDFKKYEIFEDGKIWSYKSNKWLKPFKNNRSYTTVCLSDNDNTRKIYLLHRVVYEAVTGKPIPEGLQVNHIDENKENNHISNLNLMTPKENSNYGTRNERLGVIFKNQECRRRPVAQYDLQGNLIKVYESKKEAAEAICGNSTNISAVTNGKAITYKGYVWKNI